MDSAQFINAFNEKFNKYKGQKIILYGLGKDTCDILRNIKDYDFCVAGNECIGTELFGYKVYDIKEATRIANICIIVANKRCVDKIFKRISKQCDNSIVILNMCGQRLRLDNSRETKKSMQTYSFYELGYNVFSEFAILFMKKIKEISEKEDAFFLFSSRDSFLLYQLLREKYHQMDIKGAYLYVSRRALSIAKIRTDKDIDIIVDDICKLTRGDLSAILQERLGISFDENSFDILQNKNDIITEECRKKVKEIVKNRREEIKKNAKSERVRYCKYIDELKIPDSKKLYFVDLYTKGTNCKAFIDITDIKCELLCLAYKDELNQAMMTEYSAIYEPISKFSSRNICRYYELLEIAFSSEEGQLKYMDEALKPVFSDGTHYPVAPLRQMQAGIKDAVKAGYIRDGWKMNSVGQADKKLEILPELSLANEKIRDGFYYTDMYAGYREINMWDTLVNNLCCEENGFS